MKHLTLPPACPDPTYFYFFLFLPSSKGKGGCLSCVCIPCAEDPACLATWKFKLMPVSSAFVRWAIWVGGSQATLKPAPCPQVSPNRGESSSKTQTSRSLPRLFSSLTLQNIPRPGQLLMIVPPTSPKGRLSFPQRLLYPIFGLGMIRDPRGLRATVGAQSMLNEAIVILCASCHHPVPSPTKAATGSF